jgi:hypothetical protein
MKKKAKESGPNLLILVASHPQKVLVTFDISFTHLFDFKDDLLFAGFEPNNHESFSL